MECRYVLETLGEVYGNDEVARERGMTAAERLAYHQERSGPLMEGLRQWGEQQFAEHKVEPNSGLGKAIRYLLKHWEKLTLFLRREGAPLDNNICERAVKKAILHRKNALFYKTINGAPGGDLFIRPVHTCELFGAHPFRYPPQLPPDPPELQPKSAGKRFNVGRVALYECQPWGHLMPTPAGQAKVDRNVNIGIKLFLGQLP